MLLLDNREVRTKKDRDYIFSRIVGRGVRCEVRQLPLGDIMWIARRKGGASAVTTGSSSSSSSSFSSSSAGAGQAGAGQAGGAGRKRARPKGGAAAAAAAAAAAVEEGEVVLQLIVERKRVDDLAGSIKDGRYAEQKFRLQRCGISSILYVGVCE